MNKYEKIWKEALSTHVNLTQSHIKTAVEYLSMLKISDDSARRIALVLNYNMRSANYAFMFNYYVDRAITKPALDRLKVIASMDFKNMFQEFDNVKVTNDEKESILGIVENEYKELITHGDCFPMCN